MKFLWNGVEFNLIVINSGKYDNDILRHNHSKNSFELHFVNGGKGKIILDEKEYKLKKRMFYVTGRGVFHEQITDKKDWLDELCIYLQADSLKTNDTMASVFLNTPFWIGECDIDFNFVNKIYDEYISKKLGCETVISGMMIALLTLITRLYVPEELPASSYDIDLNDKRLFLIECAFLHRVKELTLTALSEEIGICERQTERILKKYYGMTFREKKKSALNDGIN